MSWYEKGRSTPFDHKPIEGLWFLDGDQLAEMYQRSWTEGQKYPVVVFPSGEHYAIWESADPENAGIIHLFGEMDLRYNDTRDLAYEYARQVAEQCGYYVERVGENQLKLVGHDRDEHLIVTYDNQQKRMVDVVSVQDEAYQRPVHPGYVLMNEEIRGQLPELYTTEEEGWDAIAPVKYFTPDGRWTWYPVEFDGKDRLYGLVIGFEIELGPFSLAELQSVRGALGLPIERDLFYAPKTLRELKEMHEKDRRR